MKRIYKKIFVMCLLIIVIIFLNTGTFNQIPPYKYEKNLPLLKILWWAKMPYAEVKYDRIETCGIYKCNFTTDRSIVNNSETKVILFHGTYMLQYDFPIPRLSHHIWALYHEETPKNIAYLRYEKVLKYFNYTATFSRYSDYPLTTQYIRHYEQLRTKKYLVPIAEKSKLRKNLGPVVFLQSRCETLSGRDDYIAELMKYIPVDSYGNCLKNRNMSESLSRDYLLFVESNKLYRFLARYKFIIAYENGICNDYVTEKFWRSLIIGSIPIYFGSPTIKDWFPNEKSAILISEFKSPKDLADFIKYLDKNDAEYNKYLDHKYSQISNSLLKKTLFDRHLNRDLEYLGFECFVCEKIHNIKKNQLIYARGNHYNCSDDIVYPKNPRKLYRPDLIEGWYKSGKCQAETLNNLFTYNVHYTFEDYEKEIINNVNKGICKKKFSNYILERI